MNRYRRLYRDSHGAAALTVAISLIELAAILPVPVVVKSLFDELVLQGQTTSVIRIVVALALLRVVASVISLYNRRASLNITKQAITRLRSTLYEKLYALSYRKFRQRDISQLHTLIVDDTERVDVMSAALLSIFIPAALGAIGIGAVLFYLSPVLALIIAVAAPAVFLLHKVLGSSISTKVDRFRETFESFSRGALFVIRGMELTRSRGGSELEVRRQQRSLVELQDAGVEMAWSHAAYASIQNLAVAITMLAVLGVGGIAVARGSMTIGTLAGFYAAAVLFAGVSNNLWSSLPAIIGGNRSLSELISFLESDESSEYSGTREMEFRGGVSLRDVNFSYGDRNVLRGAALSIEPGQVVSLQGPNGAGKTTLVRLLLGWEKPGSGSILADGVPYDDLSMPALARQLGILPQDPFIFTGTIAENILYGREAVDTGAMRLAAEDAGAIEMIEKLPHGFATIVGDDGRLLSGGQRQRIALARALLGRPRMLILDEPGNHVEDNAIVDLLARLRSWPSPPSLLLVSHGAVPDSCVDRRYRLDNGAVQLIP